MEIEIMKIVRETVNIEDGFYSLEYTENEGILYQVSVKGENSMVIKNSGEVSIFSTKHIVENYHMVKQSDDTQFRIALQNLSAKIENFY